MWVFKIGVRMMVRFEGKGWRRGECEVGLRRV